MRETATVAGNLASEGPGDDSLEQVTVNLTKRASQALHQAAELTQDTRTDTVNRALQVYAFLEQVIAQGGTVYVRRSPDAEPELLRDL
jgi:uncharacterized protein (DUF1778 family)